MQVDFYFDPISPYVWLSFYEIEKLKREANVSINPIPTLFGGLLGITQNKGPVEVVQKRRYFWMDVLRWSKEHGVEFSSPPVHPFNSLLALRAAQAISDLEKRYQFAFKISEEAWRYGKDITKADIIKTTLRNLGLDADEMLAQTETDAIKNAVKHNTSSAAEKGVFGVPSFIVDGELFWGQDRVHFLKKFLRTKEKTDLARIDKILERPRGFDRAFWMKDSLKDILDACSEENLDPKEYLLYFLASYQNSKDLKSPKDYRSPSK